MEILRSLKIKSEDLCISTEETTRDIRREDDALAFVSQEGIIPGIENEAGGDDTLRTGSGLASNCIRDASIDIEDFDIL